MLKIRAEQRRKEKETRELMLAQVEVSAFGLTLAGAETRARA
jgi:hypothetical protein